ncbi:MAG TPA: hypothetical protein PLU39_12685, partial [Armatimonadota bacterium]|nr:hypothetical protein [Armatimonadota bacterium]
MPTPNMTRVAEAASPGTGTSLLEDLTRDQLENGMKLLQQKKFKEAAAEFKALTQSAPEEP